MEPHRNFLYSGSDDETIRVWDLESHSCVSVIVHPPSSSCGQRLIWLYTWHAGNQDKSREQSVGHCQHKIGSPCLSFSRLYIKDLVTAPSKSVWTKLVCGCSLYYAYHLYEKKDQTFTWVFGFFAVLYNPIIPVYLYEKQIWTIVNIVTAVVFIMKKDALNEEPRDEG